MQFSIVSSYRLLLNNKDFFVFYKQGFIFISNVMTDNPEKLCAIPFFLPFHLLAKFSLTERLFRIAPRCCEWISNEEFLIASRGKIYKINILDKTITCEHIFCKKMSSPLNFCKIDNLHGFEDGIVYGEYVSDSNKQELSIYQRNSMGQWHIVYSFKNGEILHIHNIIIDRYKNRLIILTGDSDSESGIFEASENFQQVSSIIRGSQQNRSCVAFPLKNKIIYATDSPLEDNYIYSYDENTRKTQKIAELSGPCIFATEHVVGEKKYFCFATSVEPDANMKGIRYLTSYKLGTGVKDKYTHLIFLTDDGKVFEAGKFRKDIFPMGLFQFGNIYFISGNSDNLYLCLQCVNKYHNKTVKVTDDGLSF